MPAPSEREQQPEGLQPENATAQEYESALATLKNYAKTDIDTINSLDDLQLRVDGLGNSLRIVVLSSGKIEDIEMGYKDTERGPISVVYRRYAIREPLHNGTLSVTADEETVVITHSTTKSGHQRYYTVVLPTDEPLTPSITHPAGKADAVDARVVPMRRYFPVLQPANPDIQRGFARVLQDAVKAVLSVAKPPTKLPPGLA